MTTQFDGLASTYAQVRPDYPDAAMRWILESTEGSRVLDVGYGTGISSRALLRVAASQVPPRSLHIEGVEPGADMRSVAHQGGLPIAALHETSAEHTGLASHTWDLIIVAQAFHWFDAPAAVAEFHRLLRPGGTLALVWNLRQEGTDSLTDAYNRVVSTTAQLDPLQRERRAELAQPIRDSPLFRGVRQREFDNPQSLTGAGLLQRATSASYFPRTEPARSAALDELRQAFAAHAANGRVALQQTCQVTLANA
ncbi:MAG: class I SAM-dependent methyltransferase [Phycisphaerae bacterium]|nr:class I SAM-dependent methyltransferase [Phycisphaerae bacterium]